MSISTHVLNKLRRRVLPSSEENSRTNTLENHAELGVVAASCEAEQVVDRASTPHDVDSSGVEIGVLSEDGFDGGKHGVGGAAGGVLVAEVCAVVFAEFDWFGQWCPCWGFSYMYITYTNLSINKVAIRTE